jgi:hypothetical protein
MQSEKSCAHVNPTIQVELTQTVGDKAAQLFHLAEGPQSGFDSSMVYPKGLCHIAYTLKRIALYQLFQTGQVQFNRPS